MKRKNGFTLIELVVVIALIAILAVTLAPRLRDQIAKAGDSKAVAILGSLRTQSEVFFAENEAPVFGTSSPSLTTETLAIDALIADLDNSSQKLFNKAGADDGTWAAGENLVPVGGSRATSVDGVSYGGTVGFTFTDNATSTSSDGISIFFATSNETAAGTTAATAEALDTKRNEWNEY